VRRNLLGNHDSPEVVDPAHDSCCLHLFFLPPKVSFGLTALVSALRRRAMQGGGLDSFGKNIPREKGAACLKTERRAGAAGAEPRPARPGTRRSAVLLDLGFDLSGVFRKRSRALEQALGKSAGRPDPPGRRVPGCFSTAILNSVSVSSGVQCSRLLSSRMMEWGGRKAPAALQGDEQIRFPAALLAAFLVGVQVLPFAGVVDVLQSFVGGGAVDDGLYQAVQRGSLRIVRRGAKYLIRLSCIIL
jgi:hypothetical protein